MLPSAVTAANAIFVKVIAVAIVIKVIVIVGGGGGIQGVIM
jgi:hypothetical protein